MNNSTVLGSFRPGSEDEAGVVSWVHLGDLHMVKTGEQNQIDLAQIVDDLNEVFAGSVNFCFLPGDVADDGSRSAYAVVRAELNRLEVPWCAIVGDHDVQEKSFRNFMEAMAERTHYAFSVGPVRFIAMNAFDVPDPGSFVVSEEQIKWVKRELQTATEAGQTKVLLLHCYPSELKVGGSELHEVLRNFNVRLVDMGHTHYNEIANDGKTLYTATRSTGQIEEGAVGFSISNLDHDVFSWRFVELGQLPLVMITSPADERLLVGTDHSGEAASEGLRIRTKIWSAIEIVRVCARFEDNEIEMHRVGNSRVWEVTLEEADLENGIYTLRVCADDARGATAEDEINILVGDGVSSQSRSARDLDNSIGAWPEHGLLNTQLGPNKNGKKW